MNYLRYTTALTGRDQAALLAIQWPLKPAFIFDSAHNYVRLYSAHHWPSAADVLIMDEASHISKLEWSKQWKLLKNVTPDFSKR